ncbi:MAG TPA: glutathione S-transferase [Oceanospirillaceae bacterium]|nr:glutathione S-transferase [Oceanospirillaceae bacterium]
MHLIIGNQNYSSWSMRPWVAMTHFGIDFKQTKVWLDTPTFKAEMAPYSSAKTVPVLITEHGTATDSLSILETLADTYPQMWPADPRLKIMARNAVSRMHSGFFALRGEMPMNCRAHQRLLAITPACRNDIDQIEALWAQCMASAAEQGQTQAYLLGEFSIADAFFAPVVVRLKGYQVAVSAVTQGYMNRLLANPAVGAWIAAGLEETIVLDADEAGTDQA